MEIEIHKSKTKLTKSYIRQMTNCSITKFIEGKILGYVVNVVKNSTKSFLIQHNNSYHTFSYGFTKTTKRDSLHRKFGKWSYCIDVKNDELMNQFWDKYQEKTKTAVQIYV